ncbi:cyclohexanone monooxygenase, partial [Kitasatospora sp. NPDC057936]
NTVWNTGNCHSWYHDTHGNNPTIWPTYTHTYRKQTNHFDHTNYQTTTTQNTTHNTHNTHN